MVQILRCVQVEVIMTASVLEIVDRQAVKRDLLLPIIFSKLGPGQPLITMSELKQAVSHIPQINFNVKDWIEDLIQQLYRYMYLDRKAPTEEERDIHGGKTRYVYWCIRELPVKNVKFVNSCIEPKRPEDLPSRGTIRGPLDEDEEKKAPPPPVQEVIPPEVAIQIATAVINTLPQMIEGLKAIESRFETVEKNIEGIETLLLEINALQILQEERNKHRIELIRSRNKEKQDPKNG